MSQTIPTEVALDLAHDSYQLCAESAHKGEGCSQQKPSYISDIRNTLASPFKPATALASIDSSTLLHSAYVNIDEIRGEIPSCQQRSSGVNSTRWRKLTTALHRIVVLCAACSSHLVILSCCGSPTNRTTHLWTRSEFYWPFRGNNISIASGSSPASDSTPGLSNPSRASSETRLGPPLAR